MTSTQYLCQNQFPLTTVGGASIKEQILLDATLFDQFQELKEKGVELTTEQASKLKELEIKVPHATRLISLAWSSDH